MEFLSLEGRFIGPLLAITLFGWLVYSLAVRRSVNVWVRRALFALASILSLECALFIVVDFTQFRHIERLQHTQWIAERDDHLPGGVVLKSEVLAAFPYKGMEEPKLEFDDHDSASITFSARAPATSKTCPIHLDDFSVTLSAPGFIGSPLLRQSIRVKDFCVLSWQTQVAPLHGGLQGIEVGVHFSPKWLRDPQDRIMPMTIHILEPRAWEENALLTSIIAAVITTVLSFAFSRVK